MGTASTPALDAGLVRVDAPAGSAAVHRLAVEALAERAGPAYWIDARNAAATHVLYEIASHPGALSELRIARAFTAYQHHELVRRTVARADAETSLVVAPNVAALYRDDDLGAEADDLFAASLALLGELGRTLDVPVLVTAADGPFADDVAAAADTVVEAERTRCGLRFEGEDDETLWYRERGFWQTTIPYWVDLFGAVPEIDRPVEPATPESLEAW